MLLWQHNFWIKTIGSLSNDDGDGDGDGDGNENGKNATSLGSKARTLHVHHAFLYISQPTQHDDDVKLPNFTRLLYELGEHNTIFFFAVSELKYGPFEFNPRKCSQHLTN